MSQANVEKVRQGYADFAERGIEAVIPLYADDVVIHSIQEWPDDPEYYGAEGNRKLSSQWEESFDDLEFIVCELRDAGDAVLALLEISGLTKDSGISVKMPIGSVLTFREGKIAEQRYFSSWEAALKAAGFSE